MSQQTRHTLRNVVLVHGGFVDGSGWEGVYDTLKKEGYTVAIVQHATMSLADDVAATKRVIAAQDGPVVLVGHSYGGAVITEAGTDPKVARLVYIAAFAPDAGESVATLIQGFPSDGRSHRSCRRRTVSSCSIGRSFQPRSPEMWAQNWRPSWPMRNCRGAWTPSTARSASLPGGLSRVGTCSRPRTG